MIYADQRWIGDHGIGRFARRVLSTFAYQPVDLASRPSSALDAWRLARALKQIRHEDLFFSPGYNAPLQCHAPYLFTLHDLNHIDRPENSSIFKRLYYATILKRSCRRAERILTVSEFTRQRIIEWSGVEPEHVINVSCGVDPQFNPGAPSSTLPFPYLLCVSNRKPHKNETRTVEAFARSGLGRELNLVFTGDPTPELMNCMERNQVTKQVHFAGLVPDAELPSLYRSAQALIFVSLYEGFGLPLLEAMACGIPVLTSNTSALPELAGDAALLVDPSSVEEIAAGLRRIVSDSSLRATLTAKGVVRASAYSWDATAAKVRQILVKTQAEKRRTR